MELQIHIHGSSQKKNFFRKARYGRPCRIDSLLDLLVVGAPTTMDFPSGVEERSFASHTSRGDLSCRELRRIPWFPTSCATNLDGPESNVGGKQRTDWRTDLRDIPAVKDETLQRLHNTRGQMTLRRAECRFTDVNGVWVGNRILGPTKGIAGQRRRYFRVRTNNAVLDEGWKVSCSRCSTGHKGLLS